MPGSGGATVTPAEILEAIGEVRDPELPVSVVDLGLVYDIRVEGGSVEVDMTLTSMGCPCHEMIVEDVRDRLAALAAIDDVTVNVVWDPPWTRGRITAAGRKALAGWGITS